MEGLVVNLWKSLKKFFKKGSTVNQPRKTPFKKSFKPTMKYYVYRCIDGKILNVIFRDIESADLHAQAMTVNTGSMYNVKPCIQIAVDNTKAG
jgi:hypothetical protein